MTIGDIEDNNCLVEVYLHFLLKYCNFEVDKIGYVRDDVSFGIYHIWDNVTNKYILLFTNSKLYLDKRVKKRYSKEKRSTVFYFPKNKKHSIITEDNLNKVLSYFSGKPTDMEMMVSKDIDFAVTYLSLK